LRARELVGPIDDDLPLFRKDDHPFSIRQVLEFGRVPDDWIRRDGVALEVAALCEGLEPFVRFLVRELEGSGDGRGGENWPSLLLTGVVEVGDGELVGGGFFGCAVLLAEIALIDAVRRIRVARRCGLASLFVGRRRRTFVGHCPVVAAVGVNRFRSPITANRYAG